uniref:5'-Nucleotidase C-terminal domain-containing protein n=1 Tax=candidate division WOR-3 bacterium TaxID=2052148 RepID=A0A7C6EDC6_UNCW3
MTKRLFSLIFSLFLLIACAVKPKVTPIAKTITIFYTNGLDLNNIARIAKFVKQEKGKNPCLFIIKGKIFGTEPITTLLRGEAEIAILNRAGVDAVILSADFLRFGTKRAKELQNQGDFFFLGANLFSVDQSKPLAQEYLIKNLAKTKISLIGVLLDTTSFYLKLSGIERKDPVPIIKRLVPMLRLRSDLVGLGITNANSIPVKDVDFVIGLTDSQLTKPNAPESETEPTVHRFDLLLSDNNMIIDGHDSKIFLADTVIEDSSVKATIERYQTLTDSILDLRIINLRKDLTIENLLNTISSAVLVETKADGFIFSNQLVKNPIPKGRFSYRNLFSVLTKSENLPIIFLKGREIQALKDKELEVRLSPKWKNSKLVLEKDYQIVTATDLSEIDLSDRVINLTDSSLVSIVFNYLTKVK